MKAVVVPQEHSATADAVAAAVAFILFPGLVLELRCDFAGLGAEANLLDVCSWAGKCFVDDASPGDTCLARGSASTTFFWGPFCFQFWSFGYFSTTTAGSRLLFFSEGGR